MNTFELSPVAESDEFNSSKESPSFERNVDQTRTSASQTFSRKSPEVARRPKILIIDDSSITLKMTKAMLEPFGYEVVIYDTSENPFGATNAVKNENPDLILLDINMAALSGDKVAELLEKFKGKIVFFSDKSEEDLTEKAQASKEGGARGVDGFIKKTGDSQELFDQVSQYLKPLHSDTP